MNTQEAEKAITVMFEDEDKMIWEQHNLGVRLSSRGDEGLMSSGICVVEHAETFYIIIFGYDFFDIVFSSIDFEITKKLFNDDNALYHHIEDTRGGDYIVDYEIYEYMKKPNPIAK